MRKAIIFLLILVISLCACENNSVNYLTFSEAKWALINFAEPLIATAVNLPTYAFEMDEYEFTQATHYEDLGYWYFEVEGYIPMYDNGLWYIEYTFDAKVDNITGNVDFGSLETVYP